jgi:hypothetical protein
MKFFISVVLFSACSVASDSKYDLLTAKNQSRIEKMYELKGELSKVKYGCCKVCTKGCACGDTCISCSYNCTKGVGCACDG